MNNSNIYWWKCILVLAASFYINRIVILHIKPDESKQTGWGMVHETLLTPTYSSTDANNLQENLNQWTECIIINKYSLTTLQGITLDDGRVECANYKNKFIGGSVEGQLFYKAPNTAWSRSCDKTLQKILLKFTKSVWWVFQLKKLVCCSLPQTLWHTKTCLTRHL